MVDLLEQLEERDWPSAVSRSARMDRIRPADERQRLPFKQFGGDVQPRLTMAVELMESNIEEPLSTEEIAHLVLYRAGSWNGCLSGIWILCRPVLSSVTFEKGPVSYS
ncbi:hypothetical protein P4S72_25545 [Vibrio sp. PP-XX7]